MDSDTSNLQPSHYSHNIIFLSGLAVPHPPTKYANPLIYRAWIFEPLPKRLHFIEFQLLSFSAIWICTAGRSPDWFSREYIQITPYMSILYLFLRLSFEQHSVDWSHLLVDWGAELWGCGLEMVQESGESRPVHLVGWKSWWSWGWTVLVSFAKHPTRSLLRGRQSQYKPVCPSLPIWICLILT